MYDSKYAIPDTSAINMGPIRYDTVLSGLGNFVPMNLSPFLKYLLSFGLNMSASSDSGGATRTGSGGGGAAAALVGEESRGGGVTQTGGDGCLSAAAALGGGESCRG